MELDREECRQLEALLAERFVDYLKSGERFTVSVTRPPQGGGGRGGHEGEAAEVRFELNGPVGSERLVLEAKALGDAAESRALNALDQLLFEYFEGARRV